MAPWSLVRPPAVPRVVMALVVQIALLSCPLVTPSDQDQFYSGITGNLNPCANPPELFVGEPMLLGVLSLPNSSLNDWSDDLALVKQDITALSTMPWPGATEWYNRPNFNPPPCFSSLYSNFSDQGATMSVFETKVDSFSVLKTPPTKAIIRELTDGMKGVWNGTVPFCCTETTAMYNSLGYTAPYYSKRLDPFHHQLPTVEGHLEPFSTSNGVAVMHPLLVISEYASSGAGSSVSQQVSLVQPVPLSTGSSESYICDSCRRWNPVTYLGQATANEVLNTTALKFTCLLNTSCAWGPLFCETCLNGTYANEAMPGWFVDNFVMRFSENGTELSATEMQNAEVRACDTFCSTFHQVWFMGADANGNIMRSAEDMSNTLLKRPFYALRAFHFLFGLSSNFLDSLTAVGLV